MYLWMSNVNSFTYLLHRHHDCCCSCRRRRCRRRHSLVAFVMCILVAVYQFGRCSSSINSSLVHDVRLITPIHQHSLPTTTQQFFETIAQTNRTTTTTTNDYQQWATKTGTKWNNNNVTDQIKTSLSKSLPS